MQVKNIYIVVGFMGDYSTRAEWLVRACAHEEGAQALAKQAGAEAAALYAEQQARWNAGDSDWEPKSKSDPHIDEFGIASVVSYFVTKVELEE